MDSSLSVRKPSMAKVEDRSLRFYLKSALERFPRLLTVLLLQK